jgi:hypothetical protein
MCFSQRVPHTPSITSHSKRSPAISKSEFDIVPTGLRRVLMFAVTSSDHCHRNTVGVHDLSSPIITPPMPWPDASTIPTQSGQLHVSSQHVVGSRVDSRRSVRHPSTVVRSRWLQLRKTYVRCALRTLLHGDSRPTPVGMHVNACQNFATVDSNSLNGIPVVPHVPACTQPFNRVSSFSRLASSSHIVLFKPSKLNPRSVFLHGILPLPLNQFLF